MQKQQSAILMLPRMVPLHEVARRIGIDYRTIKKHTGDFFPVLRLASHDYVRDADLVAWAGRVSDTGSARANSDNDDRAVAVA